MEDLFRKTHTRPYLYWLPVSEEEVARRVKNKSIDEERSRSDNRPDAVRNAVTGGAGGGAGRSAANGGGRRFSPLARRAPSPKRVSGIFEKIVFVIQ